MISNGRADPDTASRLISQTRSYSKRARLGQEIKFLRRQIWLVGSNEPETTDDLAIFDNSAMNSFVRVKLVALNPPLDLQVPA